MNNSNTNETFTDNESWTIRLITQIFSSISFSASLFIFILYWFFKENRAFNLELVIWYSLSNMLYYTTAFFPYDPIDHPNWCAAQSFMITMFQMASLFWTCIIGYTAFISIIKKDHLEKYKWKYRILFLSLAFLLSGALSSM